MSYPDGTRWNIAWGFAPFAGTIWQPMKCASSSPAHLCRLWPDPADAAAVYNQTRPLRSLKPVQASNVSRAGLESEKLCRWGGE